MKILFQNRTNVYDQPGGDTVVMNNLKKHLEHFGHTVHFSSDHAVNLDTIDIVHLFNLTLQSLTDKFAQNAERQKTPYFVTPLQENFPLYLNKACGTVQVFKKYLEQNQSHYFFEQAFRLIHAMVPSQIITAPYTLAFANRHFACSEIEKTFMHSFCPQAKIDVVHFGSNIKEIPSEKKLFEQQFQVSDFVLCVGRLEARKNQLMLLKALEDVDLPLVFADGGFTYVPAYKELCLKYKRKGKTIFTGRLSNEMLISAYKSARVHCLPSWYELPGLVTLEAARYGCPVIAGAWGAISDYMLDTCFYCQPDDYANIRNVIIAAYNTDRNDLARIQAEKFTWEKSAQKTLTIYEKDLNYSLSPH